MKKILFLFGTRPEAIKMAPLINIFKKENSYDVKVAVTAQHREMLDQVLDFFEIIPDYDLDIMSPNQTLHSLTSKLIEQITEKVLLKEKFDFVFLQGDTTTVLAGALASFYQKIPIIHIEAGLRSENLFSPFPEEANRVLTSCIASYHFCPTPLAQNNLEKENITENVYTVGNTVIDALLFTKEKVRTMDQSIFLSAMPEIDIARDIILMTVHRRENFGEPFKQICEAVNEIAKKYPEIDIVYPVHLNPNIKENAKKYLTQPNIKLIKPLDYPFLVWLMDKSKIILTDSGGIQEESPSLGKPVLVLREVTERIEGINAGTAKLVGSNKELIVREVDSLLTDHDYYHKIATTQNPYGDGESAKKILSILSKINP